MLDRGRSRQSRELGRRCHDGREGRVTERRRGRGKCEARKGCRPTVSCSSSSLHLGFLVCRFVVPPLLALFQLLALRDSEPVEPFREDRFVIDELVLLSDGRRVDERRVRVCGEVRVREVERVG